MGFFFGMHLFSSPFLFIDPLLYIYWWEMVRAFLNKVTTQVYEIVYADWKSACKFIFLPGNFLENSSTNQDTINATFFSIIILFVDRDGGQSCLEFYYFIRNFILINFSTRFYLWRSSMFRVYLNRLNLSVDTPIIEHRLMKTLFPIFPAK